MDYAEYKRLKDQIEVEYQKQKDALEMVWRMSQKDNPSSVIDGEQPRITLSDAMRKVINGLAGDFTADDIEEGLKDHNVKDATRLSITNTLHRLSRRGEIVVVKKGIGRLPGTYRMAQKAENKV